MAKTNKTNKKNTRITLADLIAKKEQTKADKKNIYELEIKEEGTIQCQTLDRKTLLDSFDLEDGDGDLYLIYESCIDPNLKDKDLQKEFGITGYEIVEEIFKFKPGTITQIAQKILEKHGYYDKSVNFVKDIKN